MNTAYYDSGRIVVVADDNLSGYVKAINGARRVRGKWYIPLYRAQEVTRLAQHGFRVQDYIHKIRIPIPEKKIEEKNGYLVVSFPQNRSLDAAARKLGGIKSSAAAPDTSQYLFPLAKRSEVHKVFSGFNGASRIEVGETRSEKVDTRKAFKYLGDLSRPTANGWTLFEHQKDSVRKLLNSDRGKVLALDFGLGKSYVASVVAGAIQATHDLDVIIVTPASLIENWRRETKDLVRDPIIVSDHYSSIPESHNRPYVLLADEAHRLAGYSQRAGNFVKLASESMFTIPITGVPVRHGNPATAYNLLKAIGHPIADIDRSLFDARYSGSEATTESFWQQTRDDIIYKRKRDCLDLPEKTRILREVDVTPQALALYKQYFERAKGKYLEAVRSGEKQSRYFNSALVHYVRQSASLGKVPSAVSLVEELLAQDRQVVLFVAYKRTATELWRQIDAPIAVITGSTPVKERQSMVDEFQQGKRKVAICSFGAAGFGLTMTAADTLILVDRPFSVEFGDVDNAESRIDRISQKNPTTMVWLQFAHSGLKSPDKKLDRMILSKHEGNQLALTGKKERIMFANELGDYMADYLFA